MIYAKTIVNAVISIVADAQYRSGKCSAFALGERLAYKNHIFIYQIF
jgi:hypothetical protein